MKVTELSVPGVLLLEPRVFKDERGFFVEQYRAERYGEAGITRPFVQDNLSKSSRGVLRGLHYQHPYDQAKLVSVPHGKVLDVAVDLRVGSPAFGTSVAVELSGDEQQQLYIPRGCAHGFFVLSDWALLHYKCDEIYHQESEGSVRYDDPELGIAWPEVSPTLSAKDAAAPLLRDIDHSKLPRFGSFE